MIQISGQARFDISYLTEPLQFCTHLMYGFAGINWNTKKIGSLNELFDVTQGHFRQVTDLKRQYPGLRIILSVGGGRDTQDVEKYLTLVKILITTIK